MFIYQRVYPKTKCRFLVRKTWRPDAQQHDQHRNDPYQVGPADAHFHQGPSLASAVQSMEGKTLPRKQRGFLENFSTISALQQKNKKKKRGRSSTRFNGLHQQTFEERSHRSYITGTIMKAFQRLQVLNRWVGYQEASMYVCMHACMHVSIYLSIYVSMYLCIYVSIYLCIYVSMCIYIYMCATGINYVIYVICVQHVYIIYISVNYHVLSTLTLV